MKYANESESHTLSNAIVSNGLRRKTKNIRIDSNATNETKHKAKYRGKDIALRLRALATRGPSGEGENFDNEILSTVIFDYVDQNQEPVTLKYRRRATTASSSKWQKRQQNVESKPERLKTAPHTIRRHAP